MKLLLLLLVITIAVARQASAQPLIQGPIADVTDVRSFVDTSGPKHQAESRGHITSFSEMHLTPFMDRIQGISKRYVEGPITDLTDLEYFVDKPGPKHKSMSGKHIDSFSEIHLTPYIDLISGIPVEPRMVRTVEKRRTGAPAIVAALRLFSPRGIGPISINLIPVARREAYHGYRKRMMAQRGILRSSARQGKMHKRGPSSSSTEFVDKRSGVPSVTARYGQKFVWSKFKRPMSVPDSARRKWWKRGLGFRSRPEAELPGSLGSQFYNMVYGKNERSFPGNRLPIVQFLTADKRDTLKGIPRTGAPIRQFLIPADRDLQTAALFKSLPKIITAFNNKIHERIFRPLDPNASDYPPVNEGIEERLRRPLRPVN